MVDMPTLILISVIMLLIGAALGFALSMLRSSPGPARHDQRTGQPAGKQPRSGGMPASRPLAPASQPAEPDIQSALPADSNAPLSAEQGQAARFSPLDVFARALTSDVPKAQPVRSLAAQIDAILQEKLEGSDLSNRGIRLQEHPQKGLIVQVGLNRYESVDEVPEKEIRDFIRQAIAEWEKQADAS